MSAYRTLAEEDDLRSSEFFKEADRDVIAAFQRVLSARVSDHPLGLAHDHVDWVEIEQELARFCDLVRIRHMAKHCAIRERMFLAPPIIVVREDGGDARVLEGVPDGFLDRLRKRGG